MSPEEQTVKDDTRLKDDIVEAGVTPEVSVMTKWLNACKQATRHKLLVDDLRLDKRLLRLFAVAVCRDIWTLIKSERSRTGVEVAERFADGKATEAERQAAYAAAYASYAAAYASYAAAYASASADAAARRKKWQRQGEILVALVGESNQWSSVYQTSDTTSIARLIYEDRQYDLFPILADSLQDAGCPDGPVLEYCRGDSPFFRGCWVLDKILRKRG